MSTFFSPEQNQEINRKNEEQRLLGLENLRNKAEELGYQEVSSFEELGLTPKELERAKDGYATKEFIHLKKDDEIERKKGGLFLKANRAGGTPVKVVAIVYGTDNGNNYNIAADLFSPGFYEGMGCNHDFNFGEMAANLKNALKLEPYPLSFEK